MGRGEKADEMPRDNAGYTGQVSRNPTGRGTDFPGKKKISTYYLTVDATGQVKQLAGIAGRSRNAFVEGLIRTCGAGYAADLLSRKDTSDDAMAEESDPAWPVPVAGA